MKAKEPQDSRGDKDKRSTSEKTGPSRRQFLAHSGRVAAGIGAVSLLGNAGQQGIAYAANESLITKVGGTGGAKMKKQDAPQRSKEALAAAVKAELSAPIVPGEIMTVAGDIEVFKGRETKEVTIKNVGDRPIQVGSHCHFFETNRALKFDREQAFGFRLAIPAGTAVRFEPGEEKKVTLVALAGNRLAQGVNGLTDGLLDDPKVKAKAVGLAADRGFGKGGAR
ncbi:MAG: Urease beta subunit [Nitrospira sp.]|jgi:urease beta subunit|nr:MAG: Urease beta subunit [Nitrospira sp.]